MKKSFDGSIWRSGHGLTVGDLRNAIKGLSPSLNLMVYVNPDPRAEDPGDPSPLGGVVELTAIGDGDLALHVLLVDAEGWAQESMADQ